MKISNKIKTCLSLTVLAFLLSCLMGCEGTPEEFEIHDPVTHLDLSEDSGSITVTASDVEFVHVHGMVYGNETTIDHSVQGENLVIRTNCHGSNWNCSVDYTITVPHQMDVVLHTDSGSIHLDGIEGNADLTADSGSISVGCSSGERLSMHADSGSITASGLHYESCSATADSGSIDLRFESEPDDVYAEADSGSIDIFVPANIYNVLTNAGSGAVSVDGITVDPQAIRTIQASADSGSITIRGQ